MFGVGALLSVPLENLGRKEIYMIKLKLAVVMGAALALASIAGAEAAAQQIFLKFPGLPGASTQKGHEGEIILTGFSTTDYVTIASSGGGGGAGKPVCGQVSILKPLDMTGPQFLALLFKGRQTAGPVTITFETTSGNAPYDYYKIDLQDVLVTSISQSDPQDNGVNETIVLHADRFKYTYYPTTADGRPGAPVVFGWDCLTNRAF